MSQKYYLVKVGPPDSGEYMTAPGYFRATKHEEKLTPSDMARVWNRDYTNNRSKAHIVTLAESSSPNYNAELENLHALARAYGCRLEQASTP
jgi:hypothetical protein